MRTAGDKDELVTTRKYLEKVFENEIFAKSILKEIFAKCKCNKRKYLKIFELSWG